MTQQKMTDFEFAMKVEYEGGPIAALDYGLRSSDLVDEHGPLARAWRRLEIKFRALQPDLSEVDTLLSEAEDAGGNGPEVF